MLARILFLSAFCVLVLAGCNTPTQSDVPIVAVPVNTASALATVNAYRAAHGVPAMRADPRLNKAAADLAQLMANVNSIHPSSASRRSIAGRFENNGFRISMGADFSAEGHESFNHAFGEFRRSPNQDKYVLNPDMTRIGFARAQRLKGHTPRNFWVITIARAAEDGDPGA